MQKKRYLFLLILSIILSVILGNKINNIKIDAILMMAASLLVIRMLNYGKVLYSAILLLSCIYFPITYLDIHPSVSVAASIVETNTAESIEFFKNIHFYIYFLAILLFATGYKLFPLIPKLQKKSSLYAVIVLFIALALNKPVRHLYEKNIPFSNIEQLVSQLRYPPIKIVLDWRNNYLVYKKGVAIIAQQKQTPPSWDITGSTKEDNSIILILGESVRKDYMNAYGFPLNNTPFLSTANGQLWGNFTSAAAYTIQSVLRLLSLTHNGEPEINNNIITLANQADF